MASISFLLNGKPDRIELTDVPVHIGRKKKVNQIQFEEQDVSREHARVFKDGDNWKLEDTESSLGTKVNGKRIVSGEPVILRHRDRISIGPHLLTFENEAERLPVDDKETRPEEIDLINDGDSSVEGSAEISGYGLLSIRPQDKLNGILKINEALAGNVDVRAICPLVLDALFDIFPQVDRGVILFLQPGGKKPLKVAQRHRNVDESASVQMSGKILEEVLRTKKAVVYSNAMRDVTGSESVINDMIHSSMCVPMMAVDGQPFGVVSLDSQNPHPRRRFSQDDLQLLVAVASQASHVFENARLMSESIMEKVNREKRDEEMRISAEIQMRLIPKELPQPPGYQFFGSYDAAQAVGGDYFDCFGIPGGKICISFGDVSGKGIPAALIMSRLSGIVRSTMNFTDDVGLAIGQINKLMCINMAEGRFVTYILGVIDPGTHTLTFANAGHLPPEIRSPEGEVSRPESDNSGFPIGWFEDYQYETSTIHLAPGTSVFLRTDGIDDAMSPNKEFYGTRRFREFLRSMPADPEKLGRALLADVKSFMAGFPQHDDITIMSFGRLQSK